VRPSNHARSRGRRPPIGVPRAGCHYVGCIHAYKARDRGSLGLAHGAESHCCAGQTPPARRPSVAQCVPHRELAGEGDDQESGRALERTLGAVALVGRDEPGWGGGPSMRSYLAGTAPERACSPGCARSTLANTARRSHSWRMQPEGANTPGRRITLHQDRAYGFVGLNDPERASAGNHGGIRPGHHAWIPDEPRRDPQAAGEFPG
jgi:hypothetical protein